MVKYLGLVIDENLNWNSHVQNLSMHLARYSVLFYKICFNVSKKTLCMLYHRLVNSKMLYGTTMWETTSKTTLDSTKVMQNRILRTMLFCNLRKPLSFIYEQLNILKSDDMY